MRVRDDAGNLIDATFDLEPSGRHHSFIFHSKGGGGRAATPRNLDYNPALRLILDRLGALWVTLDDAAVVSSRTAHLPLEQRRLTLDGYVYPLAVGPVSSTDKLRKALCRAQRTVGREDGNASLGNPSKRIQVWFTLPTAWGKISKERLGRLLAGTEHIPRFYALLSNPKVFDPEAAAKVLTEDTWALPEGEPRLGDGVVYWRADGGTGRKGVVAFAGVIGEAEVQAEPPASTMFRTKGMRPEGPLRRIRVRYHTGPGLPLLAGGPHDKLLRTLSVSRAQGGDRLYHLTPPQWWALHDAAAVASPPPHAPGDPDDQQAGAAQVQAAEQTRTRTGQGFSSDAVLNKAIELRAMAKAQVHLEGEGWRGFVDTSASCPYDLTCLKDGKMLYVEVKGTTSAGVTVFVTKNEIAHARNHPGDCALVVVYDVQVTRDDKGIPTASGGEVRFERQWIPADADLTALTFRYVVPGGGGS